MRPSAVTRTSPPRTPRTPRAGAILGEIGIPPPAFVPLPPQAPPRQVILAAAAEAAAALAPAPAPVCPCGEPAVWHEWLADRPFFCESCFEMVGVMCTGLPAELMDASDDE
ncbi:hypothetical protein Indivirus_4_13 [Indivirus ILV1]|uniref:Uncharacterized protein n=1 Tax=Indivirus ILV1 TaxID=1977633 RepID=A0A1V0SDS6_9VIRU|nr:hypothetical protein Indivirus_4_13 [Indivirus ILV1]